MQCELCLSQGDTVVRSTEWRVVMVNDEQFPGFCRVIWNQHVKEMSDLSDAKRISIMQVVFKVEHAVREIMQPDKVNLASLGNVVPHLHWHVIPRFSDDSHYPNPIWGKVERNPSSHTDERRSRVPALRNKLIELLG